MTGIVFEPPTYCLVCGKSMKKTRVSFPYYECEATTYAIRPHHFWKKNADHSPRNWIVEGILLHQYWIRNWIRNDGSDQSCQIHNANNELLLSGDNYILPLSQFASLSLQELRTKISTYQTFS